ncbi:MAG: Insulinase (Peptidase M16) [Geoglossum umbratile]|nr:MAG: Insulinase (Peptidase M16) [Geoglossum umbratile]
MALPTPRAAAPPVDQYSKPRAKLLTSEIEKPSLDDRAYRVIQLPNKLEALLVHDAETDKASAAMDVYTGSYSDRDDMLGMAHAVEHLLLMGTKKYPKENDYMQYLNANSGWANAYTASTSTNFYFEVAAAPDIKSPTLEDSDNSTPDQLEQSPLYGSLDRFAQFFIAPLFDPSTLDRELRAVDSENKNNLQSDSRRLLQVGKSLSNPDHHYCRFSTGNLETLRDNPKERGIDVREEFMKFHEREYSANRMKLVVLGRESLDVLESWVVDMFWAVPNKDLPPTKWDHVPLLTEKELLTQVFMKPVMDNHNLDISFPFLAEDELYESHPSTYLSHLIGHEGPGSVLAFLKDKGWADNLFAGACPVCPGSAFFTINVGLTEDGLEHYKEVVKIIFQYIALVKETPPQEWIVDELKSMAEVFFRFSEKTGASDFTSGISATMQTPVPREWLLSGSYLIRKFDPEQILRAMGYLRPDNFRISISSQKFPGDWDQKEKWYGTEYKYEKVPQEFLAEIKHAAENKESLEGLYLPCENEFIPTDLGVTKATVDKPAKAPKLIRNDDLARVWWKKDDTFWVPKANVYITLRNPLAHSTPSNAVKTVLYCSLVNDLLALSTYDATLAGLSYNLYSNTVGMTLSLSGFNDKMPVLLEKLLVAMRDLDVKSSRFKVVKDQLLKGYQNWELLEPYYQVKEVMRLLTRERHWTANDCLVELRSLEAEDVKTFFPELLRQMHFELFVHGNISKADVLKMTSLLISTTDPRPLRPGQFEYRRGLVLPENANFVYPQTLVDPQNLNNCTAYFVHVGDSSDRMLWTQTLLLQQMTDEAVFSQLRTKEQLGYTVFSGTQTSPTRVGYRILVQGERSTEFMESRIEEFLRGFNDVLKAMSEEEFEGHKRSLVNKQLEKHKNLGEESQWLWGQIDSEYYDFDQVELDVAQVKLLTKSNLLDFYSRYIFPSAPLRSKLSVHLLAKKKSTTTPDPPPDPPEPPTTTVAETPASLTSPNSTTKKLSRTSFISLFQRYTKTLPSTLLAFSRHLLVVLRIIKPHVAKAAPVTEAVNEEDRKVVKEVEVIKDVQRFKAGLPISLGITPVMELEEFLDVGEQGEVEASGS